MATQPVRRKLTVEEEAEALKARAVYLDGAYLAKNPKWHVEESAWKVEHIVRILERNQLSPKTICDVGCGAGEVLKQLQTQLNGDCELWGFDVSPQAIDLAMPRANEGLYFHVSDIRDVKAFYDLLIVLDVFEHIEDYFSFLRQLKAKSRYKIFHIPLDLSVQTVFRKNGLFKRRELHEHLHYFTKETALQALRDAGYEVLDWSYTSRANDLGTATGQRLLKLPRKFFFALHKDVTVRLLGGYSLIVLAR